MAEPEAAPPPARRSPVRVAIALTAGVALVLAVFVVARPSVLILGDSIIEWGAGPLDASMRWQYRTQVVGHAGFRADELVPVAAAQRDGAPDRVVLDIGTNDALQRWPVGQTEVALRALVDTFPAPRCLVLTTVNEHLDVTGDARPAARQINERLRAIATARGAVIADWSAAVGADLAAGSPGGSLTIDLVHPSPAGYATLARLFDDALARCP